MSKNLRIAAGGRRAARLVAGLLVTGGVLLAAAPARASATVNISVVPRGEVTVTFTTPDGKVETHVFRGDTTVRPSGAGPQTVVFAYEDKKYEAEVDLPLNGNVQLVFDPTGTPPVQFFALAVEEVTVTAERVEANLQKVPVSVTALTSRALEVQRVANVQQVSYQTPNLWMEKNTGTSSGSRAAIRGIGEDESFFTSDTPVGIYVDDVYIPRQIGAQFDLYDVDRIEVLRGPQGTLYGRNTSAGAIKLVSKQPGNKVMAHLEGTFGQYTQADFKGSVSVPIAGGKTSLQIAGMRRYHEGYDRNIVDGRKVNDQDLWGGRASIRLLPVPNFNILLVGDYLQERSTPGYALGLIAQPPVVNGAGMGNHDLAQQVDGDTDVHTLASDLTNPLNDIFQRGASSTISYAIGDNYVLKSVTAYRNMYNLFLVDADGQVGNNTFPAGTALAKLPLFHLYQDQKQEQWSQELQVSGQLGPHVRVIGGYFYFHERNRQITENLVFRAARGGNYSDVALTTDSNAVYGNVTVQPTSGLSATIGVRYTDDKKDYAHHLLQASGAPVLACYSADGRSLHGASRACLPTDPAGARTGAVERFLTPSFSGLTPRFAVDYAFSGGQMLYASASRGFKSGAFDGRNMTAGQIPFLQPISQETLWTYEGGIKSDWLQHRLRVNLAAFLNDWKDLQGSGTDPEGNFRRFTIGDVQTKGLELEARATPVQGLELSGQLSLLRTEFTSVNFNQAVDCAPYGTGSKKLELKMSPHQSYSLTGVYMFPQALLNGSWSIAGTVSGKTKFYHSFCNPEAGSEDGFQIGDLSVAYETRNGRVRVTGVVENIWDEQYQIGSFTFGAPLRFQSVYLNPPRRVSVTIRYAFN